MERGEGEVTYDVMLLAVATFFSTIFGGLVASRFRHKFGILAAFAAAVLISVPLFDLLPEALKIADQVAVPIENIFYAVAIGFVFLYVLERFLSVHRVCDGDVCRNVRHPKGGLFGASELSAHSFMDGLAIGIGFQFDVHVGVIVGVAVISHDFSDGVNTVTVMLNAGNSLRSSLRMLLLDAATPILGAAATLFFTVPRSYLTVILPFFAGGFFYLGASDLLPEAHERNPPIVSLAATAAGFVLIFVVTRLLNV